MPVPDLPDDGTRSALVHGPPGIGRTTVLDRLAVRVGEQGGDVLRLRYTPDGPVIDGSTAVLARVPPTLLHPVDGARHSPALAARVAAPIAMVLDRHRLTLLVDDLQRSDPDSIAVLAALVPSLTDAGVRAVFTVQTPVPGFLRPFVAVVRALRRDGVLDSHRLRPLDRAQTAVLLGEQLRSRPAPELVDLVLERTRGVPEAVLDLLGSLSAGGRVVISDRHAYLGPGPEPGPRPDGPLLRPVRRLGPAMWPVATAVALLAPLGPALPRLLAASLDIDVEQARDHLDELVDAGVLHRGGADDGWRFPVPQVAVELAACLRPYERRWVAVTAVVALWTGVAHAEDPDYLTDRIAEAGALLDTARARSELIQRATIRAADDPHRTRAWWLTAADLSSDRADEALARWMYATSCYRTGDYATAVTTIESVLDELGDVLPEHWVVDAGATMLGSMRSLGDLDGLRAIAHGRRELPGDVAARSSWRALALFMLGRWRDALELLDDTRWAWRGPGATSYLGDTLSMMAELGAGRPRTFEALLADRGSWPEDNSARRRLAFTQGLVTLLLLLSEVDRARRLMADEGLTPEMLSLSDRASLAFLEGRTAEAKDLARRYRVGGFVVGHDAGLEMMQQHHAFLLLARGEVTRAREFLDEAIAAKSSLRHLLAAPRAVADVAVGDLDEAVDRLQSSVADAEERGVLIGTDATHLQVARIAMARGDLDGARRAGRSLERLHGMLATSRTELYLQLVRSLVDRDRATVESCLRIARERGLPLELATVIGMLGEQDLVGPDDLWECYDLYGELGALLCRSWVRGLMTRAGMTVPGRTTVVAENERLLGLLVGQGFGNRTIATILQVSEKSVEGRLGRLFARAGYRSRTELMAAMQGVRSSG
ncbi:ATP-binding protein [Pseudonocardia sp. TMWB2A]|uniref:ATP-binding protein n=1 Tax=Pseudonocardia sp. TMWB2A TaxID=687430 RepID=UPI00307F7DB7